MTEDITIGLIGFGEAGRTFASAGSWGGRALVYDHLTCDADQSASMLAAYEAAGVQGCETLSAMVAKADLVLSLVTADQAGRVAQEAAAALRSGALYMDLNSVAPTTKRASAEVIEAAGGRYVDVAVMSPVQPAALQAPLLVSGPHASEAAERLSDLGFTKVRTVGDEVGRASSIKMIRSVMVKGLEALSAECVLAADRAGVLDEVLSSLEASWSGAHWQERADYNLDRMMIHGLRRSAEMAEVVRTLEDLGMAADMSRSTVALQSRIGALHLKAPPKGLEAKLISIQTRQGGV